MSKKKYKDLTCPECNGAGTILDMEQCYFCYGTGFATDEDTFEPLYREDDWRY